VRGRCIRSLMRVRSSFPFVNQVLRHNVRDAALICPRQDIRVPCSVCAEVFGLRAYPDSAQVQSISVPAGLNGHITNCSSSSVISTCDPKEFEFLIRQLKERASQLRRKVSPTATMIWVVALVEPSGIVKHREQSDHLQTGAGKRSQTESILKDPCPVGHSVNAPPLQRIPVAYGLNQFGGRHD